MSKKLLALFVLLIFANVSALEIDVWVGGDFEENVWNDVMDVAPDSWVDVPVYIMGQSPEVYVADMMFPLGINKTYIDRFGFDNCRILYPLTEWDVSLFTNLNDEFEEGWARYSFLCFSRISSDNAPWVHWEAPTQILSFNVHVAENALEPGEVVNDAFGPGFDPRQGNANMGDTIGHVAYELNQHFADITFSPTSVEEEAPIPDEFFLADNYPNPFNATTIVNYGLPEPVHVTIVVYDILGRQVETLVDKDQQPGYYQITWNSGNRSSGMYFYQIHAGDFSTTKKMLMLK